jgi:hypothetical protein
MFKALIIGIWGCLIAAGSSYAVVFMHNRKPAETTTAVPADKLERRKVPPLTVPVLAEGKLQGYLIVQLALLGPAQAMKAQDVPPEVLLSSVAFSILYSDDKIDFRQLKKYDLKGFTDDAKARMDKRLGPGIVSEVAVDEFNYVSKDDLRK